MKTFVVTARDLLGCTNADAAASMTVWMGSKVGFNWAKPFHKMQSIETGDIIYQQEDDDGDQS